MSIINLQNKAKSDTLDIYLLFYTGLKFLKKNREKEDKPMDWLEVIECVVADDLHHLICGIIFPDNEKDLMQLIEILEKNKFILQNTIKEKKYDAIVEVLFSIEDNLSRDLCKNNFAEYDNSEFTKIIQSIPNQEWDKM